APLAQLLVEVDDRLRVRAGREPVPAGLELVPERLVVVDGAVEDDPDRAVLIAERLVAALGVDDGEPAVGEANGAIDPLPVIVRTAVPERRGHSQEPVHIDSGGVYDATKTAHGRSAFGFEECVPSRPACRYPSAGERSRERRSRAKTRDEGPRAVSGALLRILENRSCSGASALPRGERVPARTGWRVADAAEFVIRRRHGNRHAAGALRNSCARGRPLRAEGIDRARAGFRTARRWGRGCAGCGICAAEWDSVARPGAS